MAQTYTEKEALSTFEQTNLQLCEGWDDWWVHPADNPIMLWEELLGLALKILHSNLTKSYHPEAWLPQIPEYSIRPYDKLPEDGVSGAKRVNAIAGSYTNYSDFTGANALIKALSGKPNDIEKAPKVQMSEKLYRLSGKDESCVVEGSWRDWVCFAHNVLASPNTKVVCPELYQPKLENDNY